MIILHSPYLKKSRDFISLHGESATQVINWYGKDSVAAKATLETERRVFPRSFPSIVSDTLPVILELQTDDPASELAAAEQAFLALELYEYGSSGFGTSWAELVKAETISIEKARDAVSAAIKAEAQVRILSLWEVATIEDSQVRQTNTLRADIAAGTTDERFTQTDAIRAASNTFESALADMNKDEVAALVVREWDGWPNEEG